MESELHDAEAVDGPLRGITVLDLTQVQFGPMATQILADFGANVIKIEKPGVGDLSRYVDISSDGREDSGSFLSLNRNKRSIELDLSDPRSEEILDRLLSRADVLVMNFRAGVAERLGLDYERLHERFPRLIYAAGTGYGHEGKFASKAGQDMLLQALSGAAWHARSDGDPEPKLYPLSFIDFGAGMALTQGILLALIGRSVDGQGCRVDVSMFDTALFIQMQELTTWFLRRHEIQWEHDSLSGAIECADGWIVVVGLFRPAVLKSICDALGIEDMSDWEGFREEREQIARKKEIWSRFSEATARLNAEDVVSRLESRNLLACRVLDYDGLKVEMNELVDRGIRTFSRGGELISVVDNPIELSRYNSRNYKIPPFLGEHTEEILVELGYDAGEVLEFLKEGVVRSSCSE